MWPQNQISNQIWKNMNSVSQQGQLGDDLLQLIAVCTLLDDVCGFLYDAYNTAFEWTELSKLSEAKNFDKTKIKAL